MIRERSAVLGRVQAEGEPQRHVGLRQPADPWHPADGGDAGAPVGDADLRELLGRAEHGVEVHQRLAHAHEHEVIDGLGASKDQPSR